MVLSTLLDACDADYKPVVIADCCADRDAELHGMLLKRLFPQRAEVLTAAEDSTIRLAWGIPRKLTQGPTSAS